MQRTATRTRLQRGDAGGVYWELASRRPDPALTGYVHELQGYVERAGTVVRRREPASTQVVVILEFEPRLRIYDAARSDRFDRFPGGFVAGIGDAPTWTEHPGQQEGIQLNLHPLGARRLFALPLHELRDRALPFAELVPEQRGLCAELAELPSWDARFDRLEAFLRARLYDAPAEDPIVSWTLRQLARSDGQANLRALVAELGYSHKHVIARFHDQVGVPPKLWARLLRFERLRKELAGRKPRSWAELAVTCGYYDQAHLARDVRQFSGETPGALLRPGQAFVDPER